jgi:hypothetical protein
MADQVVASVRSTLNLAGMTFDEQNSIAGDGVITGKLEIPAAVTGTLTVRTDANTGSLTMAGGHGIVTGARLDIYWTAAGVSKCQRGVTAGVVAGNVVPIDLGVGDDLPAAASAVIVGKVVTKLIQFNTDNAVAFAMSIPQEGEGVFVWAKADNTEKLFRQLGKAGEEKNVSDAWLNTDPVANPMGANQDIGKVFMSHKQTDGTRVMQVAVLINDVP